MTYKEYTLGWIEMAARCSDPITRASVQESLAELRAFMYQVELAEQTYKVKAEQVLVRDRAKPRERVEYFPLASENVPCELVSE